MLGIYVDDHVYLISVTTSQNKLDFFYNITYAKTFRCKLNKTECLSNTTTKGNRPLHRNQGMGSEQICYFVWISIVLSELYRHFCARE